MQVFDLMQLPATSSAPVTYEETAHFGQFGSAHNIALNEETGYAYPVGAFEFNGGPIFINIQDPANPVPAGGYAEDGYTHDAQIVVYNGPDTEHVGKEVCFASNENTLTIIDISDKADPDQLSRTGYEDVAYAHQGWLTEDHRYFLSDDEVDELSGQPNTRTIIWDCLDLDEPVVIGEYFGPSTAIDHNMYVKGDKVYQANYNSGMRVLDLSDIANANLSEVGYFDVHPPDDAVSFNGSWSVYPYFESGLIIISSIELGLFVVKASEDELPEVNCTPSALAEEATLEMEVFPNPVSDLFTVRLEASSDTEVTLSDALGRTVFNRTYSNQSLLVISVEDLDAGIYHLLVRTEDGLGYERLRVE
jgi:choice-of-anchor B domain-containing protein